MKAIFFLGILVFAVFNSYSQKKWAGPTAGEWKDSQNWQPQGVPASTDEVVLDNSNQRNNFIVNLPDAAVSIRTLSIEPANGLNIELLLPTTNKSSPALIITDGGNSFNLKSGAVFRNSSALSAGQSIQTSGVISIYNDGKYVHNSRSSHATEIVARLSLTPGTERGIFEFDVPGGSYPISLSNRTFGTLMLSSSASGGVQTYNASGSNQVVINGDFQINDGVQFNLDLTKDMVINGDFIQKGGVFNLASQPNNNTIKIKGDVVQSSTSMITETSGGLPVIELSGAKRQIISIAGGLQNSVGLKVSNSNGVALKSSLTLPYKLELSLGAIKTSTTNLLTLADNCTVAGGSVYSFIDGPIKKVGDDDFEFPVGKQGDYAPVRIAGSGGSVTDEFIAEYFLGDPSILYGRAYETPALVRISKLEYWIIERSFGSSAKRVGVYVGNYSNATALKDLVLVRWDVGLNFWKNEGNSFYSGVAVGELFGNEVKTFGVFTVGSTVEMQNPLPLGTLKPPFSTISHSSIAGNTYLHIKSEKNELVTLVVSNAAGASIRILNVSLIRGGNDIVVNTALLAKGILFCQFI